MFLAHLLPPNAMSARLASASGQEQEAKCLIISQRDFARACSTRARDHFVQTRMAQTVQLAWARDAESAADALARVRAARMRSVEWMGVFLPRVFDLPTFCRSLIGVLFAHEIRAESAGHPDVLYSAQDDILGAIYGPVLDAWVARGVLARDKSGYRQRQVPGRWRRWRIRSYFRWSKVRTTIRLLKHPFLYDNWLEYLTRKVESPAPARRSSCHPGSGSTR